MSAPVVTADGVSKWYGQVIGLNDISVEIGPGVTGLLGPNGAGKSTFLKLITGQLKPSKGTVRVLGEPIWGNPNLFSRLGFCPDQDSFYERMTGLKWVTALTRLNGVPNADATEAARRALGMVDLLDAADKKIGAYSKGMRQRVKLAQAVVHDPELLVLDEPLAGMDPIARRELIRLIKGWGRSGEKRAGLEPHPARDRGDDLDYPADQQRPDPGRGQHPHDSRPDRRAPAQGEDTGQRSRGMARGFLSYDDVLSLQFENGAVVVETGKPDAFYGRLTELAATGALGEVYEVSSPDDNLQAVFEYLVKS